MNEHPSRREFLRSSGRGGGWGGRRSRDGRGTGARTSPSWSIRRMRWHPPRRRGGLPGELERALAERGLSVRVYPSAAQAPAATCESWRPGWLRPAPLRRSRPQALAPGRVPEALALCQGREGVWACGHDARGLTYALLELADRVRHAADPLAALAVPEAGRPSARPTPSAASRGCSPATSKTSPGTTTARCGRRTSPCWPRSASTASTSRFGIGYDFLTQRHRRLLPVRLSVPAFRAGLQRARAATAGRRARPQPGDAALHQRADRGARPGVPTGHLDARLPVDREPERELHDRRPHRRNPRPLLPRRAARAAAGRPEDQRRHLPRPRRERRRGGQLRVLEDRVRRRGDLRPQGRDRHARQGHGPGHDRRRAGHRPAGEDLAQVLGRAPRHAVPPGRHPRAGTAPRRAARRRGS